MFVLQSNASFFWRKFFLRDGGGEKEAGGGKENGEGRGEGKENDQPESTQYSSKKKMENKQLASGLHTEELSVA